MNNQWYNCKMERKIDRKVISARRVGEDTFCPTKMCMLPTAKYYSEDGTELVRSSWREVEHEDDYRDAKIVVVDWNMDDQLWLAISGIIIIAVCVYFGLR